MNVEKTKVMRISTENCLLPIMIDRKKLETLDYLNYLGSMITNDVRRSQEIKFRIAMEKQRSTGGRIFSPAN